MSRSSQYSVSGIEEQRAKRASKAYDELRAIFESAPTKEEGGGRMDEATKMMLERLERDAREREERYHNDAREREKWQRDRDDKLQQLIKDNRQETKEDIAEIKNAILEMKKEFKSDSDGIRQDLKTTATELKTDFKELKKSTEDTNKWIIGMAITTIIAVAAIVVSVLVAK